MKSLGAAFSSKLLGSQTDVILLDAVAARIVVDIESQTRVSIAR